MKSYSPYQQQNTFQQAPQQARLAPGLTPIRIQGNLPSPSDSQFSHTQRVMYKSTIQSSSTPFTQMGSFGLGKLESMGRTIMEETVEPQQMGVNNMVPGQNASQTLKFRSEKPQRARMAASVICFNKNTEGSPSFGGFGNYSLGTQNNNGFNNLSGLDSLARKVKTVQEEDISDKADEKIMNSTWTGSQKNNRQMFKSSIDSSNRSKTFSSMSGMNFQNTITSNNFKAFQFHRNKAPINNAPPTQVKSVIPENPGKKEISHLKPVPHQAKITPSTSGEGITPTGISMMKKKNPCFPSNQNNGKTDQTLLKMLGINLKGGPKQTVLSPKIFENVPLQSKQPAKSIQPIVQAVENKTNITAVDIPQKLSKSDFHIGKKMGKGQFGQVMLVQHKLTGFLCGMKIMSKKEIKSQKYQNQIARQLSIQFYLDHRHVTPLYGYFEDEDNVYLLVQFCTDGQLLQKLRKDRRMQQADVSPIIREICEGMNYIHKEEIIHRDIKPQNIMFNLGTVKIGDFGWAVHSGNGMRRTISGSPLYYSPEIVQETAYDEKIDIWSIGMMTYECLLGKIPFRIYSQLDLNRIVSDDISFPEYVDVTDEAKDFILKIMKKKPEDRMEMREIMRHPFITKYAKDRKIGSNVLEEFKNVLKL